MIRNRLLITAVALAAAAPLDAQTRSGVLRPPGIAPVVLGPGDAMRIEVWRKAELSGQFTVTADGSLTHPLYRAVHVAGVPLATAEARLRAYLEQLETNPQFVLEPLFRVSVGGEVARPNLYMLAPETSIAQALALAGGPTQFGRRDRTRLRRGEAELHLDIAEQARTPIRSGDQILVDRRRSVFRDYIAPVIVFTGAIAAIINAAQNPR